MSPLYLDTGLVLKLLVAEPQSPIVQAFIHRRQLPVWYSRVVLIEVENTLQAMRFRRQLTTRQCNSARSLANQLLSEGKFIEPSLSMDAIADEMLRLAPILTPQTGCRTLDLLHLAAARLLQSPEFISTDRRQLAAARLAGFITHDLSA